jgi:[ribosomal protein S18]-alanine N-acetyltransferase
MNYTIIPMNKSHISAVANIEKVCFASPWTEEGIAEELENSLAHFLVAVGEEVMGYIGVHEICGEGSITNVAVMTNFRCKGIGKALVSAAIKGAKERNCEFITLEVRKSNFPAISLYSSLGFEQVGLRKNFYSSPNEDAVLMTKTF